MNVRGVALPVPLTVPIRPRPFVASKSTNVLAGPALKFDDAPDEPTAPTTFKNSVPVVPLI